MYGKVSALKCNKMNVTCIKKITYKNKLRSHKLVFPKIQNLWDVETLVFLCTVIKLERITGQERWLPSLVTQDTTWKDLQTDCVWKMDTGVMLCQHVREENWILYIELWTDPLTLWEIYFLSSGHRKCDEPAPLVNGYKVGNEFWEGKNVTYKCNKGYWLRGPLVRVCNDIGNWTEDEPTCEGKKASRYSEHWLTKPACCLHCTLIITLSNDFGDTRTTARNNKFIFYLVLRFLKIRKTSSRRSRSPKYAGQRILTVIASVSAISHSIIPQLKEETGEIMTVTVFEYLIVN